MVHQLRRTTVLLGCVGMLAAACASPMERANQEARQDIETRAHRLIQSARGAEAVHWIRRERDGVELEPFSLMHALAQAVENASDATVMHRGETYVDAAITAHRTYGVGFGAVEEEVEVTQCVRFARDEDHQVAWSEVAC